MRNNFNFLLRKSATKVIHEMTENYPFKCNLYNISYSNQI